MKYIKESENSIFENPEINFQSTFYLPTVFVTHMLLLLLLIIYGSGNGAMLELISCKTWKKLTRWKYDHDCKSIDDLLNRMLKLTSAQELDK